MECGQVSPRPYPGVLVMTTTIEELFEEFEHLQDWEDRCDFLIDLGFELEPLPDSEKTEQNIVHGCQSRVWLVAEADQTQQPARIKIRADSEAMIVKGLIAVLIALYSGKTPEQILSTDVQSVFEKLGLTTHLSSTRRNGLYGMVNRVRAIAEHHLHTA
jgi:cysteine desulfuration protein SufE